MHVSQIHIYPIKSMGGIRLDASEVEPRGLRYDRRWMIVTPDGRFVTQREVPAMARVRVGIRPGGLIVSTPGITAMQVPFDAGSDEIEVAIWDSVCTARAYPEGIDQWFSQALGIDCRLVEMPDDSLRPVNRRFDRGGDIVSFADGYPLLLIGQASLDELNSKMDDPLPMERFRPNIVVKGCKAFDEDEWERVKIGQALFRVTKPCARCVITTVDQERGEFNGNEPLKTLAEFRMARDVMPNRIEEFGLTPTAVLFGANLIPETRDAAVMIGDGVEIIERYANSGTN